ncbi:hypothetical protein [Staphylococcus felis]|uniref:AbrB family transcriptional regulator n=1 Tax=Staphylococcus felis TaxID=46127 RepID=A0ABS0QLM3_9STAP|nr:hypothetical protein [Staphylococcus felis]AVP37444.1 hypothetical protein C7J90_10925 [Staphylococcus felis]MBH9580108.1 hypothetical protein [Staphylococcus felis]PNZ36248.1 hypothetical protein CD143_04595 [Staphylococcus felis]QQB02608.1 hypothetical protein I6H71_07580 [Staphylococcus felis]REI09517.1 hypothetical protein DOS69_01915 [Staphylococcus felis]
MNNSFQNSTNDDWRQNLPEGYMPIYKYSRPTISFDAKHNRFYMSSSLLKAIGLRKGSRVGMAYNKAEDSLIIVTKGGSMFIDKSSYITSRHFAEETGYKSGQHYYEYIEEESSDEYKMFRKASSKY